MNIQINHNTVTINSYSVAKQLEDIYLHNFGGEWSAETVLQYIAHSTLNNFSRDLNGCVSALYYLNQKLEAVRKTINFWDAYQIIGAEEDKDLLLNKLAQIPNNSSIINNVNNPFQWLNPTTNTTEQIYRGDAFIKNYQGIVSIVHAANKGVFVPQALSFQSGQGNSLSILYEYTNETPPKSKTISTPVGEDNPFNLASDTAYNHRQVIPAAIDSEHPYQIPVTVLFNEMEGQNNQTIQVKIIPIVKFFLYDATNQSTNGEMVFIENPFYGPTTTYNGPDGTVTLTDLSWIIQNPTPFDLWFEVR